MNADRDSSYRYSHTSPQHAEGYHRAFGRIGLRSLYWQLEQKFLRQAIASLPTPARALDFACGTGRVSKALYSFGLNVTAIDVSNAMLEIARRDSTGPTYVQCDITVANEGTKIAGDFDIVTAFRFFPNAEDSLREAALAKISTLLKPGGLLICNNHRNPSSPWRQLAVIVLGRKRCSLSDLNMIQIARKHELKLVERHSIGFLPLNDKVGFPWDASRRAEHVLGKLFGHTSMGLNAIYVFRRL